MRKSKILGVSASLRSARSGAGLRTLMEEIIQRPDREALEGFLTEQASIHLDQFISSGRAEGKPFDELYRKLQSLGGRKGLSNSEVCLAAALWAAHDEGCDIDQVALSDHFPASGEATDLDLLKKQILAADGILLSTPVYFGDRSSLAQRFVELVRSDAEIKESVQDKIFAGVSVGAKRNGGQETTLIYQMFDMLNVGMLAVGNDSGTTSQYGGTAHAGDIGTIMKDSYGIDTCLGTGRRIARVAEQCVFGTEQELIDLPKFDFWLLQDKDETLKKLLKSSQSLLSQKADVTTLDMTATNIRPCIACDICPIHVGPDEEYRCIIKKSVDGVKQLHEAMLRPDIIVPVMYSPVDRSNLSSVYQEFMERTRYLRRGDYVFTDRLVVPMVFAEIGSNENLDVRMMTSFVRHHTVLCKPLVAWIQDGKILNELDIQEGIQRAIRNGTLLTSGRLGMVAEGNQAVAYNPVGYVLSLAKDNEPDVMEARKKVTEERFDKLVEESHERLVPGAD
jgi:multimeric flavodoxin WrbA